MPEPLSNNILARIHAGIIDHARRKGHYRSKFSTPLLSDRWETFPSDTISEEKSTACRKQL